jgi:pimeloyl-ACP methyl ester carboxylesterase
MSVKYGDNPSAGHYNNVNGIKIYFETYGDSTNQPIVLIHGNGGAIRAVGCQIEYFKSKFYVIAVDSRFHGKTDNGNELLTYDLIAKDYNLLLEKLKIDSAYIMGQSDGGIIGLLLAMQYPKKVKKLVTVAPNLNPTAINQWYIDWLKKEIPYVNNKINSGDTTKALRRYKSQLLLMDKYPNIANKDLSKIQVPTLVMASDGDMVPLEHILEIYYNVSKAQLFIMPGATHFMLRGEYALFNQIVDRFLSNPFRRPTTKEMIVK